MLGKSTLRKAKLSGSDLSAAILAASGLSEADLSGCTLQETNFDGADLTHATIQNAALTDANFLLANLNAADFRNSTLDGITLKAANLDQTDFKNTKGTFFLDDNSMRGTRFSSRATDPYSILHRNYTGPMFFLTLLLTAVALLPYAFKAMAWSFAGNLESRAQEYVQVRIATLRDGLRPDVYEQIEKLLGTPWPSRNPTLIQSRVWKVVVGLEEQNAWGAVSITVVLLIYNVLRGWLTFQMSGLRDAEERSHHSPARSEYERLHAYHSRFLRWFAYVAFALAAFNIVSTLGAAVYVPAI